MKCLAPTPGPCRISKSDTHADRHGWHVREQWLPRPRIDNLPWKEILAHPQIDHSNEPRKTCCVPGKASCLVSAAWILLKVWNRTASSLSSRANSRLGCLYWPKSHQAKNMLHVEGQICEQFVMVMVGGIGLGDESGHNTFFHHVFVREFVLGFALT